MLRLWKKTGGPEKSHEYEEETSVTTRVQTYYRNTTNKTLMIMSIAATFMNNKRVEDLVKHD